MAEQSIESQIWSPQPKHLAEIERKLRAMAFRSFGCVALIPISGKLSRIYGLTPALAGISYAAVALILMAVMYPLFASKYEKEQQLFNAEFERLKPEVPNPLRVQIELKRDGFLTGKDSGWLWIEGANLYFRGLRGNLVVPASPDNRVVKVKDKGFSVVTPEFGVWVDYPVQSENIIPGTKFYEEAALWQSQPAELERLAIFPRDIQDEYWFDSKKQWRILGMGLLACTGVIAFSALVFLAQRTDQQLDFHIFAWPSVLATIVCFTILVVRQRKAMRYFQMLGLLRAN